MIRAARLAAGCGAVLLAAGCATPSPSPVTGVLSPYWIKENARMSEIAQIAMRAMVDSGAVMPRNDSRLSP